VAGQRAARAMAEPIAPAPMMPMLAVML